MIEIYTDKKERFELSLSNLDCNACEFIAQGMAKKYGDLILQQSIIPWGYLITMQSEGNEYTIFYDEDYEFNDIFTNSPSFHSKLKHKVQGFIDDVNKKYS